MLSKNELVGKLNQIVESAKLSKNVKLEFDNLLNELTTRKTREIKHPDYYDDEKKNLMRYCKYHQRYERDDEMIAKKSYCRSASFISNHRRNEIKHLENELLSSIQTNADASEIAKLADVIKEKKQNMHAPETYDYERDNQYYLENCRQRKKKQDDKE